MLEIDHLDFEEVDDWLSRLALSQVVQNLEKQKECFHLKESFKVLQMFQDLVQIAETDSKLLCLVAHGSAVVQKHGVQVHGLTHE